MESRTSTSGFTSETSISGNLPHTPPYTPHPIKRRFARSESPASVKSTSIKPTETESPAKKERRITVDDTFEIEELEEGDAGYAADVDVVYPDELEEADSDSEGKDGNSESDESDTEITQNFSRLGCQDGDEARFERIRREKAARKRTRSHTFKRSHSQSVKGDVEVMDSDAMGDHDLRAGARRLRRRVRGPLELRVVPDASRASPSPALFGAAALSHSSASERSTPTRMSDDMDVDNKGEGG